MLQKEQTLNGIWHMVTDEALIGIEQQWYQAKNFLTLHSIEIKVPCCLETYIKDFEGVAWFHKSFHVSERRECTRLRFGAVNYRAEIWLNGHPVGFHEGGYTDFTFEVGDLLLSDEENHLIVRVITPLITKKTRIDGLGYNEMPHWRGAITGGIWQDVSLLFSGNVYISQPFAKPDIWSGEANVELRLTNAGKQTSEIQLSVEISEENSGTVVYEKEENLTALPGPSPCSIMGQIVEPKLWTPDTPFLYRVRIRVFVNQEISDEETFLFGMREFTIKGKHFMLNGQPLLLKAAFYEGLYPHTLAYPETPELIEKEIKLAKEAGLNLLRPWRKPQPPVVYEMADRLGILMIGAIAVECMRFWPQLSPYMESRISNDLKEMILRDRNHPSIIMWEIFNEVHRVELKRLRHPLAVLARSLDGSRTILDESGGFYDGASVYLPEQYSPSVIADVHFYPGAPVYQHTYQELYMLGKSREQMQAFGLEKGANTESLIVPDVLTNITELGYGSAPDLPAVMETYAQQHNPLTPDYLIHKRLYDSYLKVLNDTGVMQDFGSLEAFCQAEQERHAAANKDMLEACRVNPDVGGIGIHAFVDGDWVVGAGMLDIHRNPKKAYWTMKQAFQPEFVAARTSKRNYYPQDDVTLDCHVVNDGECREDTLQIIIETEDGTSVFATRQLIAAKHGVSKLSPLNLGKMKPGSYCVRLGWGTAQNETAFTILQPKAFRGKPLQVLDFCGTLTAMLNHDGVQWEQATQRSEIVYVCGEYPVEQGQQMASWAEKGATIVLLELPEGRERVLDELVLPEGLLPFPMRTVESFGYWTPNNHIVRKGHPLFRDLPAGMMDENYQNVSPRRSVRNQGHEWVLGMIGYGWWQDAMEKQNYSGVTEAFDAADVFWRKHGKGRYLLSTMRLVQQFGQDPYADQIFYNLAYWLEGQQ